MVLPEHSAYPSGSQNVPTFVRNCRPRSARPPGGRQPARGSTSPVAMSVAEVLEDLPAEMQQAVFSHLDLPSVRALRRVSAGLHAIIGSRDFQKARHSVGRDC